MAFDLGAGINTISKGVSSVQSAVSTAGRLAGALNNLSNPAALVSSLRSLSLPKGGELSGRSASAIATMGGADANNDWRVRLSIPSAFLDSPVLNPLRNAGGLIFPYTPSINISSSANYEDQAITHQNFQFIYYTSSRVDQIQITAPFNVEDGEQALYWLAAVHMLRSSSKMFTGNDPNQGNPPPIMRLNGYGDYVLRNIPVVIKSFSIDLPQDVNYINTSVSVSGSASNSASGALGQLSNAASTANKLAGLAGALGANSAASALGKVGAIGGAIAGVGKLLNGSASAPGIGSIDGSSWVPTKSTLSVTLQPIYSREAARNFSLTKFVNGGYVRDGYL